MKMCLAQKVSLQLVFSESAESAEQHLSMNSRRRSDVYGACMLYMHMINSIYQEEHWSNIILQFIKYPLN